MVGGTWRRVAHVTAVPAAPTQSLETLQAAHIHCGTYPYLCVCGVGVCVGGMGVWVCVCVVCEGGLVD